MDIQNLTNTPILVSIRCCTYNHESYIRRCLDGFVMQKTNFRFEAIVHDDASTDGTAAIVREYASRYPDIIKPIFEEENQYSKHDGSISRIMNSHMRGKYIAMCEGDDYWIDPYKLQKQVDFLESHPEYAMCFHNCHIHNETPTDFRHEGTQDRDYSVQELFSEWIVPTASMLLRKECCLEMAPDLRLVNSDIHVILSCFAHGKVRGMKDKMSVYRVQENGVTIKRVKENPLKLEISYIDHYKCLKELYPFIPNDVYKQKLANTYINIGVLNLRLKRPLKGLLNVVHALFLSPKQFVTRLSNLKKHERV